MRHTNSLTSAILQLIFAALSVSSCIICVFLMLKQKVEVKKQLLIFVLIISDMLECLFLFFGAINYFFGTIGACEFRFSSENFFSLFSIMISTLIGLQLYFESRFLPLFNHKKIILSAIYACLLLSLLLQLIPFTYNQDVYYHFEQDEKVFCNQQTSILLQYYTIPLIICCFIDLLTIILTTRNIKIILNQYEIKQAYDQLYLYPIVIFIYTLPPLLTEIYNLSTDEPVPSWALYMTLISQSSLGLQDSLIYFRYFLQKGSNEASLTEFAKSAIQMATKVNETNQNI